MPRQRYEKRLPCALTEAFAAVVDVVGRGRWSGGSNPCVGVPEAGSHYVAQRGKVLRRGKVLACLRPVSMTLKETLLDPPCCVELRLHWRIEPVTDGAAVVLDARYSMNGTATLRARHWYERIDGHCSRMLDALEVCIAQAQET